MLRRQPYQTWLALLGYALAALYLAAPIHGAIASRFLGGETGDVYEAARHIWWIKTALQGGYDVFEHSLLAYPEGTPAAQLWAHPLQWFPMWVFTFILPLPTAYNFGALLTLALNGWSMYFLARRKLATTQRFPAFIAGLVFMSLPTIQGHLLEGQVGLLVQWPVPLLIMYLFDYADDGGMGKFVAATLLFIAGALGDAMQVFYVLLPLALMFILARVYHRDYVGALRVMAVALAGSLCLLLFLSPVLPDYLRDSGSIGATGRVDRSIDLLGLVSPSADNPFWQDIVANARQVTGSDLGYGASYVGALGGFLALLGILYRRAARWWLFIAFVAWALALGPLLKIDNQVLSGSIAGYDAVAPLPFALFVNFPLFDMAHTPARFMLLFAAGFALLAGYGMAVCCASRLIQRRGRRLQFGVALAFAVLLLEDYKLFAAFPSVPAEAPREIHNLRRRRDIRAIYNAPYDDDMAAKEALFLQTAHGKPLIGGVDASLTAVGHARLTLLAKFHPSLLQDSGADIVIINKARAIESGQLDLLQWRARQGLGTPLFENQRYAIYETPVSRQRTPDAYTPVAGAETHLTYIYKEQPGWLEFNAALEASNRQVRLSLNDTPLETLEVNGRILLSIPLPIARRGYHTFRIALDPPCPQRIDTSLLQCPRVTVENARIEVLSAGAIYDPIRIEDGIILAGYLLPQAPDGDLFKIRLWWRFESARSAEDVRFVHVLDEQGRPVSDRPADHNFGTIPAGSELTETVTLDQSKLAAGVYRVLTGWYALPQAIRYDVLTDVDGAQDDTIVLGSVRINE